MYQPFYVYLSQKSEITNTIAIINLHHEKNSISNSSAECRVDG